MIRIFLLFIFSILVLLSPPHHVLAQSANFSTDLPSSRKIQYGTGINAIVDVPKGVDSTGSLRYTFVVATNENATSGSVKGRLSFFVTRDPGNFNSFTCTLDSAFSDTSSDPWTNPHIEALSSYCRFNTGVDTTHIGASATSSVGQKYWLLVFVSQNNKLAGTDFEINPSVVGSNACTVSKIVDRQSGQTITSVKAGQELQIFTSIVENGDYKFYFQEDNSLTATCTTSSGCNKETWLTVPDNPSNPVTVFVKGPNGSACQKDLTVTDVTPIPTEVAITLTSTPRATDPPPFPPCAENWLSSDKGFIGCGAVNSGLGMTIPTDPTKFISQIFAILLSLSGGIAILLIIRAGYQMMTSAGNAEAVKEARDRITSAIIGLLFLIFSLIILEVIGVDILHIPGLSH